jgi:hypothetical protein
MAWSCTTSLLIALAALTASGVAHAQTKPSRPAVPAKPAASAVDRLEIAPPAIRLDGPLAVQRVIVTAVRLDGSRQDVTGRASLVSSSPKTAVVRGGPLVQPEADGQCVVVARFGGREARIPVKVTGADGPVQYSFLNDVVPTLSRLGCNAGPCHGAQQGKGGFRLSLRGYAPELDLISITRQYNGRRISREAPERSLFLRKPLAEVAHRGGKALARGSREYSTLLGWLRQGAPGPQAAEPELTRVEILPGDRMMRRGETQRLLVRATFADGRTADVTHRALFAVNDPAVCSVGPDGGVTQLRPGETAVTARYLDKLAVARFTAPYPRKVSEAAYRERNNFIDQHVNAKLRQLRIEPSGLSTDEEFLRRAYLDAIGTLPTAEEARAFLDDRDPGRRERLVDALLQRPEFGQIWALKFGDLFVLRKEYMGRKYAMVLQQWLAEQFNADRGWDRIATDILTASGTLEENPGGYFFVSRTPQKPGEGTWVRSAEVTGEMAAAVFLGSRIACAKCHNHPTEKTTQDDYYHFAAFFQQLTGKGRNDGGVPEQLLATAKGDVRQPRTNELMAPRPLDRLPMEFGKDEDRRVRLAEWMVKQDDFARTIVNRVWARCFGSGIIEPVDDIRSTNPARNEPLMRALCDELRRGGFSLKKLMAAIMKSRTYQLSSAPSTTNRSDTKLFSHYPAKRMQAEELADAVAQATGVPDRFQGMPQGMRAIELADAEIPSILLDTFGRPPRVMPLDSERACEPAVSQALAMLNSDALQDKLKDGRGILNALLKSGKSDAEILEELFLRTLSRRPKAAEAKALLGKAAAEKPEKRLEAFQDILWALLNSKEFLFVH